MALAMLTAVVWGYRMRPMDKPCRSIQYIIEDRQSRLYVTERELDQLLRTSDIHPVGRSMDPGVLHRMEQTIVQHPMIRTAECYVTPRAEVKVRVTQRVPLLKVTKPGEEYYIDTDRKVMPARNSVKDSVLVATGAVGIQIATKQLGDFAEWLQDQPYWRRRIDHVAVQSPQMIYLYLRKAAKEESHASRLVLGSMREYASKLQKMRTFLENSADPIKDKQYIEYDLRYHGQVIGRSDVIIR